MSTSDYGIKNEKLLNIGKKEVETMAKTIVLSGEGSECFYVSNGQCISSLKDLANAFEHMDDGTYHHHANESRNDFAAWAEGVLKDAKLSSSLKEAKYRKSAQIAGLKQMMAHMKEFEC